IDYYKESASVFAQLGRFRVLAASYLNIGSNFNSLGNNDSAKVYYKKSLPLYTDFDNKEGIADVFHNMGNIFVNEDSLEMAEKNFLKAFKIRSEIGDRDGLVTSLSEIGSLHYLKKDYSLALEYVEKSIKLASEINNKKEIQRAYKKMSEIYNKLNRHEEAYRYYQLYSHLKDSIFDLENIQQIVELQTKYETEKKEQENESLLNRTQVQELELSRRNSLIYGLTGVAILLLVIGFLVIKQNKLRAKQRAVELEQNAMKLEQQLLRSQMNPHFIFNSLNAIQSFLYDHDPEEAGNYLSKFALLVRLILENSRKEFIPLEREIKFLEHYLELQKLRFENAFDFGIVISSDIDTKTTAIPPMLAQPFIENSLEHGFQKLRAKGQIKVTFELKDKELIFSIEDNGIGRAAAAKLGVGTDQKHESLATKITEERLSILTKRHGQTIKMIVSDLKSDDDTPSGTKVTFHIPFRYVELDKQIA
ncbi:MAG: histidine kinase, partial [Flavobacteriales bacterium]|nr:histidine kinase [Flavobacteriales bacterium]